MLAKSERGGPGRGQGELRMILIDNAGADGCGAGSPMAALGGKQTLATPNSRDCPLHTRGYDSLRSACRRRPVLAPPALVRAFIIVGEIPEGHD